MIKQISKIKNFCLGLLEKELLTVLAICVVGFGGWLARADTAVTQLSFSILDGGTITVTAPNGAENWQVDSSKNITWTNTGSVANVKIELQRTVGGSWEELTASTTNDGDYPWVVTSPATTTATIRISSVTVPAITDSSDAVFIISATSGGSSGGYVPTYPMIDSVSPMSFYYKDATELIVRGLGFEDRAWATLNQVIFSIEKPHNQNLISINLLPNTLIAGTYRLCVYNTFIQYDCYRNLITVTGKTAVVPPTTGGIQEEYYSAELIGQSPDITLKPRETAVVWVEFKNTGTVTWYQDGKNPVKLGTDNKRDRKSAFYHSSWIKYNRPVLVNKIVKPGEVGRFEFNIKAPWIAKTYTEYFKPVAEYKTWIDGQSQVKWVIKVQKQSFWKTILQKPVTPKTPTVKSTIPSTGGIIDQPFKPGDTLIFSDRIEQIYQGALKLFNNLFSKK